MAERWTIKRAKEESPPGIHPLAGCDLKNFLAHCRNNEEFSPRTRRQRISSALAVTVRQPFTLMERLLYDGKVRRYELPQAPIFLIGHWRSGTTHLHNLMSNDPNFSYIDFGQTAMPHNLLNPTRFIGRAVISAVMPKDRGMDQVKLGIEEPQEEEMALGNLNPLCYYNVFYYPHEMKSHFDRAIFLENTSEEERRDFEAAYVKLVKKLSLAGNGKQLLLKNPASTARIKILDRLFPESKFIHIVRNPYEVFASMLHHYPRLFHAFSWHNFDDVDLEEIVLYKYRRLMTGFLEQRALLGDRLLETSYEKIVADPANEIERFYDALELPEKGQALEKIRSYADDRKDYRRNQYRLTRRQVDRIEDEWGFALEKWGYECPDSIEVVD